MCLAADGQDGSGLQLFQVVPWLYGLVFEKSVKASYGFLDLFEDSLDFSISM